MFFERRPTLVVPGPLDEAAFTVKNGERLWSLDDTVEMISWLRSNAFGILGLEVYQRHGIGWGTFLRDWSTAPPKAASEGWRAFVDRTAGQTLDELQRLRSSDRQGNRLYFLAFCRESEYPG